MKATIFDAVMIGVANRLKAGKIKKPSIILETYEKLLNNDNFMSACETATTDEENVNRRIKISIEAFGEAE